MATIQKRKLETDLSDLREPEMSEEDWKDFEEGLTLFNNREFWESHEAWEEIWKRCSENSRIFFQGLIQVAAGFHQLQRGIYHGADKHFRNALWKLEPFQPIFLGVQVAELVDVVEASLKEIRRLGKERLHEFSPNMIPVIRRE